MRGILSEAMLLAAEKTSGDDDNSVVDTVELVEPPSGGSVGDELIWEGIEDVSELDESGEKKRLSPKAWKKIQKKLFTDEIGNVTYEDEEGIKHKLVVKASGQPVGVKSAFNAVVR